MSFAAEIVRGVVGLSVVDEANLTGFVRVMVGLVLSRKYFEDDLNNLLLHSTPVD